MTDEYDDNRDAYLSWQLAVATIRMAKLLSGEVEPVNDEEREWLAKATAEFLTDSEFEELLAESELDEKGTP